ncbi:hypothetical protein ACHAW5_009000 [Stephanodiscus triporus]|uniref:Uncharacterized protein n=1 Tax=Stephanodiscus triporus TaxID=2934178 RepID=A0ABD3PI87_9STRA
MPESIGSSSDSDEENRGHTKEMSSKDAVVQRRTILARKTAILNPILSDARRRTMLGMRSGESKGRLKFFVQRSKILVLPPTLEMAAARETLCRRFESLHPSRREDDASYIDAVTQGTEVIVITALPQGYSCGGWRCHAKTTSSGCDQVECLHPNGPQNKSCMKCQSPKPNIRPEFSYLRLITPGVRRQRQEYVRIIQGIDHEFERCDTAEREATEKLAEFNRVLVEQKGETRDALVFFSDKAKSLPELSVMEESLMMDIDLVSQVWQRIDARTLLPLIATRKVELSLQLSRARAELAIMIQSTFELAVPHLQRLARRFLVRTRLDNVRMTAIAFARFSAAVEMQRIARSKFAFKEAERRRKLRDHCMAVRIQCAARCKTALKERQRLYAIYVEKVRHMSAILIQSIFRCYVGKLKAELLAKKRNEQLEEQEKARVLSVENESATIIQKHYRRVLAAANCANRKIMLGLHQRVISARDGDHSSAWENYIRLAHKESSKTTTDNQVGDARKKTSLNGELDRRTHDIYDSLPRHQNLMKKSSTRKDRPKTHGRNFDSLPIVGGNRPPETKCCIDDDQTDSVLDASYQKEATRLVGLKQGHERLRGQYLLYDIPNGLDDTVARFIMAVTLRYDFKDPGESTVHGNCHSTRPEKGHLHDCMVYADPIIRKLHANGIFYIRQLLPAENMGCTLSSMGGVTNEFVLLSGLLLNVLHQMHGGRYLNRKYLLANCRYFLDTQNEMKGDRVGDSEHDDRQNFSMASLLGEWVAAGYEDYKDEDTPGGLWMQNKPRSSGTKTLEEIRIQEVNKVKDKDKTRTHKSWVTSYTAKILSENESKNPALCPYRHGKLLDRRSSTKKVEQK